MCDSFSSRKYLWILKSVKRWWQLQGYKYVYAYREAESAYSQTATKHTALITVPPDNSDNLAQLC